MLPCSSEEPDEKKLLTEEAGLASAQLMDGDMQVNQAAYNYNAWYQVWGCLQTPNSAPWAAGTSWVCSVRSSLVAVLSHREGTGGGVWNCSAHTGHGVPLSCVPG